MDGRGFASLRFNRKHNRNKNAIVLQCICAKMQEVFPGIPTHLCRESIHTPSEYIWWRPDSCSPDGLLTVKCGLSWGGLALLGGGSLCHVMCI